jgi:hypothetical protein
MLSLNQVILYKWSFVEAINQSLYTVIVTYMGTGSPVATHIKTIWVNKSWVSSRITIT